VTLDTSAILVILQQEEERDEFADLLEQASRRLVSTVSLLETSLVLEGRRGAEASLDLDLFIRRAAVSIIPFEEEQLFLARAAFHRFGKGRHPAGLNFGDCAAYALAQWTGEPLLFKGSDFAKTDVPRVRND
jgi:ribonuclease VapC